MTSPSAWRADVSSQSASHSLGTMPINQQVLIQKHLLRLTASIHTENTCHFVDLSQIRVFYPRMVETVKQGRYPKNGWLSCQRCHFCDHWYPNEPSWGCWINIHWWPSSIVKSAGGTVSRTTQRSWNEYQTGVEFLMCCMEPQYMIIYVDYVLLFGAWV